MKKVIRTCVACGVKKEKHELARFTFNESPQIDVKQQNTGRGAYVCKNEKCMDIGLKKNKLTRSLQRNQIGRNRKTG